MCVGPSLMAKTITTHVANPNHPSSPPSLGSKSSLGSAPPEGGVSKYPRVLQDLELGGVWVGEVKSHLDLQLSLESLSLRPSNTGFWKVGCGFNLPPTTLPSTNPSPYYPIAPTKTIPSATPTTPIPIHPATPIPATPYTTSTTTILIKTATGGTKVITTHPKKKSFPTPTFVCDGIGCVFSTNSPYKFLNHQAMPHNWKPGSQNWCFNKAKSLAQGNKTLGLKASSPTQFTSTDIRLKKGELLPNIIVTKCGEEPSTPPSISPTTTNTSSSITPTTSTLVPNSHSLTPTTPVRSTPTPTPTPISTPTTVTTIPTTLPPPSPSPNPPPFTPPNIVEDAKLYFPVSYFLWKRKLPPPTVTPLFPPWALFPKPRGNKVRSSSHLKWDRRLHDGTTFSFGVNDPSLDISSHTVTLSDGIGIPKFKEDGSWAKYSHLLVPKTKFQTIPLLKSFKGSCYNPNSKKRVPRPKSGQNTTHKAHGISKKDHLNGIGKINLSEVPCKRKCHTSFSLKAKVSSSTDTYPTTLPTSQGSPLYEPYPSTRTKWTRPVGGCLKGGGPSTPVTIKLVGSSPYNPPDNAQKLSIYCLDSIIECPLSLIEHHSTLLKHLLLNSGSCR